MTRYLYEPDCVSPPGHTLRDWMEEDAIIRFSENTGISIEVIQNLLSGKQNLTDDLLFTISDYTGSNYKFWEAREKMYRNHLKEKEIEQIPAR